MEKLNELTISDLKELTEGKTVTVSSMNGSAISLHMETAVLIAEPDSGNDGKITFFDPDTGCKVEFDSDNLIESIHGNENVIVVRFSNGMGELDIKIKKDSKKVMKRGEVCQYIMKRFDNLSKLTIDDIELILDTERKIRFQSSVKQNMPHCK